MDEDDLPDASIVAVPALRLSRGTVVLYLLVSRAPDAADHGLSYLYAARAMPIGDIHAFVASEAADQLGDDLVVVTLGALSQEAAVADAERRRSGSTTNVWWLAS